ncbi:hypothetical protein ACYPKM_01735 [Pseudomonas aeruginosa]
MAPDSPILSDAPFFGLLLTEKQQEFMFHELFWSYLGAFLLGISVTILYWIGQMLKTICAKGAARRKEEGAR